MTKEICDNCSSIIPLNSITLSGECPNCGSIFIQDSTLDWYTQSIWERNEEYVNDENL